MSSSAAVVVAGVAISVVGFRFHGHVKSLGLFSQQIFRVLMREEAWGLWVVGWEHGGDNGLGGWAEIVRADVYGFVLWRIWFYGFDVYGFVLWIWFYGFEMYGFDVLGLLEIKGWVWVCVLCVLNLWRSLYFVDLCPCWHVLDFLNFLNNLEEELVLHDGWEEHIVKKIFFF